MIFEFENFRLDARRRELHRGAERLAVEPQVFDLLHLLVANRDRVVSRDELLESVWNGRIVSESTISSRIAAARQAIGDGDSEKRLIRTFSRRGLRFVAEVVEREGPAVAAAAFLPALTETSPPTTGVQAESDGFPERPSVVVLPFANLSGDPSNDYFVDGMVEDITIALGRLPWLFVMGSITAQHYRARSNDPRGVGAELGVRYAMGGSVRRDSHRIRVVVELVEAATGRHVWSDRYDGEIEGVFELQDRIAANVSAMIAPAIRNVEIARTRRTPTGSLNAYDLYLRALPGPTASLERNRESLGFLRRALEIDPDYAAAYGLAAWCVFWQKLVGWVAPDDTSLEEGVSLARAAIHHGDGDSEALWMAAQALTLIAGDYDSAFPAIAEALSRNPSAPNSWWTSGMARAYVGDADVALDHNARAVRLNPVQPWTRYYETGNAFALFAAGRFEEALAAAESPLATEPNFAPALRIKAAAAGMTEDLERAAAASRQLLAARPDSSVQMLGRFYAAPLARSPACLSNYLEGLRRAQLPEG